MSVELSEYLRETEEEEAAFLERKKQDPTFDYQFKYIPRPTSYSTFALIVFDRQESR